MGDCAPWIKSFPKQINLNFIRKDTIKTKRDYILNDWNERQIYQNTPYMRCSMESHISHIFAGLFTSHPKSYSKKGLKQLLKLRLLKRKDIKEQYIDQYRNNQIIINQSNELYRRQTEYIKKKELFCSKPKDNYINFI